MGAFEKIVYSLCLVNVVICLVMAPLQLFYIGLILPWQDDCSWILLLCSIWCSAVFAGIAVLHVYVSYNKHHRHWSGLNKNMRCLVVILFVIFGQMAGLLFAKYRLAAANESKFKSAMKYYGDYDIVNINSTRAYIDRTQTGGQCCGYYSRNDWDRTSHHNHLPPSCCVNKTEDHCQFTDAFTQGCQSYFHDLIRDGTEMPLYTSMVLLITALTVYVLIMSYLQFSGMYQYEELTTNSNVFESSVVDGTHQSWRSRPSLDHVISRGDIQNADNATRSRGNDVIRSRDDVNRSHDTGYGSRGTSRAGSRDPSRAGSRDLLNGGPQVVVARNHEAV